MTGIDQHRLFAVACQHAMNAHGNAILLIGRRDSLPDGLGNDAVHHPGIEPEPAATDRFQLPRAQPEHVVPRPLTRY